MEGIASGALDPVPRTFDDDELDTEQASEFAPPLPTARWASADQARVSTLFLAASNAASCFIECVAAVGDKIGTVEVEVHATCTISRVDESTAVATCEVPQPSRPKMRKYVRIILSIVVQWSMLHQHHFESHSSFMIMVQGEVPPEVSYEFVEELIKGVAWER